MTPEEIARKESRYESFDLEVFFQLVEERHAKKKRRKKELKEAKSKS